MNTADRLIRQAPEILRRWERRVRAEIPASRAQEPLVLQNNLALLLGEVAKALSPTGEPEVRIEGLSLSQDHGTLRAGLAEYSIGEVFLEYRLLRKTILEVLDEGPSLSADEREVINNALERAMQDAVSRYAHVQQDAERARGNTAQAIAAALQEEDQRKNEFLGLLAHEIRTPLAAMTNAVHILENVDLSDERALRQLQSLARQTRHLARLAEDILDITRVVQGKLELRLSRVDLTVAAGNAVETSRLFIDARGQELSLSLPSAPVWIEADPVRLEQVVTNLLNNATKFTEPGGRIWVSVERDGEHAVLTVRDSGGGVPPVFLPQIFDMFVQADPAGGQDRRGLGMGLTVVRQLVELHGGTVSALSKEGEGTVFTVLLPLAVGAEARDAPVGKAPR